MLEINNISNDDFLYLLKPNSLQYDIACKMIDSNEKYFYKSSELLNFELDFRYQLTHKSRVLYDSNFGFAVFRNVTVNENFWSITSNGGMRLRSDVSAYDAILDIVNNSYQYSTECATAMVIVYYLALTNMYTKEVFDKNFDNITLMNWHNIHPLLREVGFMNKQKDYLAGDRQYFDNPDVSPRTTQWQGENVINLGDGTYYGHGIGIQYADGFIDTLNVRRKTNPTESAFLMDLCGRPNFEKLFYAK